MSKRRFQYTSPTRLVPETQQPVLSGTQFTPAFVSGLTVLANKAPVAFGIVERLVHRLVEQRGGVR